jgi:hypothetical protein
MTYSSKENAFTRRVTAYLKSQGALVYPLVAGYMCPRGWPDRLIWHHSWRGFLEFKGKATKTEPLQLRRIYELNRAHKGSAYVLRDGLDLELYTVERQGAEEYDEVLVARCTLPCLIDKLTTLT